MLTRDSNLIKTFVRRVVVSADSSVAMVAQDHSISCASNRHYEWTSFRRKIIGIAANARLRG